MRTRNLYSEIAEGFAALSAARDGNLTLRTMYVSIPAPGKMGVEAGEPECVFAALPFGGPDDGSHYAKTLMEASDLFIGRACPICP